MVLYMNEKIDPISDLLTTHKITEAQLSGYICNRGEDNKFTIDDNVYSYRKPKGHKKWY